MSSIGNRILTGAAWTAAESWVDQVLVFIIFLVLARLLGPEVIGLAVLSLVAPVIASVPVTRGVPEALVQREQIKPEHLNSAFVLLVICGVILGAAVWLLANPIAKVFGAPILEELVRWTSLIVVLRAIGSVPIAILKRELNFRILAFRTLTGTLCGGIAGIALALTGFGVWSLVAMQLLKVLVETMILLKTSKWRPKWRYSHTHSRELFGFAAPIIGTSFLALLSDEMPKTMIGMFLGSAAVGIYALARRPLELLTRVIIHPLMGVALPAVSRLQKDREKVERFLAGTVRVASVIGFPAFIGCILIVPELVALFLGNEWLQGVIVIQILLLVGPIRTIEGLCGTTALALGHTLLILNFHIAYLVLSSVLLLGAAQISLEATVSAIVLSNLLLFPAFLYFTRKLVRIDVVGLLEMLPRLSAATAIMAASVVAWREAAHAIGMSPEIILAGAIAIGAVVYLSAVFLLIRPELMSASNMLLTLRRNDQRQAGWLAMKVSKTS